MPVWAKVYPLQRAIDLFAHARYEVNMWRSSLQMRWLADQALNDTRAAVFGLQGAASEVPQWQKWPTPAQSLVTAATCAAVDKPAESPAAVDAKVFSPCPAVCGTSVSSSPTPSDGGFADIGVHSEDAVCPLCELCDNDLRDGPNGAPVGTHEVVICEGCQGGFHVMCVRVLPSLCRRGQAASHPFTVEWSVGGMNRGAGTLRCGVCANEGRWGVSHLIESAVTFGDACCLPKSATYSVLVRFHADRTPPEPRFLHGCAPLGCTHASEIQDLALVSDQPSTLWSGSAWQTEMVARLPSTHRPGMVPPGHDLGAACAHF